MKTCTKCGETKPTSEFYKRPSSRDGLRADCKDCHNAANAKWRKANPGKHSKYLAKWDKANPEKRREISAKWEAANREKRRESREATREKKRKSNAAWKAANLEALRIHAHNRRARKRENGGRLSRGLAERLFKMQKGKCACCGKPLGSDYHLDHIMPLALGGTNTDDNMQLLTSRCNMQKQALHPVDFMQQRGFLL